MKINKYLVLFTFIMPCTVFAQGVDRTLTLDECIQTALANNQELLTIKEQILLSQARVSEAKGLVFPKIDLNVSASQSDTQTPIVLAPSMDAIFVPQGKGQFYSTRLTLWQYLYAAGKYKTNLRLAEASLAQARVLYDISKNSLIRDIKLAFSELLFIKAKKNVLEGQKAKKPADTAKITQLELEEQKAYLGLLYLMGLELNTIIAIDGSFQAELDGYDLNKCLAWSYQYRPELRQTQFQEAIDTLKVNLSMTERYPTVTLGANYEQVGDTLLGESKNLSATLNLNVPVFDGWAMFSRIKQRKIQAREGKIKRAVIEDKVQLEVRKAFIDYSYWHGRLAEDIKNEQDAAALSSDIKIYYIQTIKNYLDSKAQLDWSMGKNLLQ